MFLCECGKLVSGRISEETFKEYISTSQNPSTRTIGHRDCGLIFNFVDGKVSKKYSSKKELKVIAAAFAENNKLCSEKAERFLLEVDRLKSCGIYSDEQVLVYAYKILLEVDRLKSCGIYSDEQILVYAYKNVFKSISAYESFL